MGIRRRGYSGRPALGSGTAGIEADSELQAEDFAGAHGRAFVRDVKRAITGYYERGGLIQTREEGGAGAIGLYADEDSGAGEEGAGRGVLEDVEVSIRPEREVH